jgi:hypothetical protein
MPIIFECGKWKGTPSKGTMTPRQRIGRIFDRNGDEWEILFWKAKNKSSAAQFLVRTDLSVGRKIFFSSREDAISWRDNPINPTPEEIKFSLARCDWHEPSKGLTQLWLNIRRA